MNLIFENLSHILTLIGIIVSLYCWAKVRRSKFIVIKRGDYRINNLPENLKINSQLYLSRLVICYLGANDTKKEDVEIPLTIVNNDSAGKIVEFDIITLSETYQPHLDLSNGKLIISSPFIKHGDSVEFSFKVDSSDYNYKIWQRIYNVDTKVRYFEDNNRNLFTLILYAIILLTTVFIGFLLQDIFSKRNTNLVREYNVEFNYKGKKIFDENYFKSSDEVDSIFIDEYTREKERELSIKDNTNLEQNPDLKNLLKIRQGLHELQNTFTLFDSVNLASKNSPSKIVDSVFIKMKMDNKLEYDKNIKINDDLTVKFINLKEVSFLTMLIWFLIFVFYMMWLTFLFLATASTGIEYYYITAVKKYIK